MTEFDELHERRMHLIVVRRDGTGFQHLHPEFEARPFPAPRPLDESGGYEVRLDAGDPVAGETAELTFAVSRGGRPVDDLAPYLGTKGHLVALRERDLAFLHVHPEDHEVAAEEIEFAAGFPIAGRYRLYLQFRHEGSVRTAEFTVVAR